MMWPWMWGGMGMGWMMWAWIPLLLGFGWFFFWWLPGSNRIGSPRHFREDPLEVARMRLAKGEITPEEFERLRNTIES